MKENLKQLHEFNRKTDFLEYAMRFMYNADIVGQQEETHVIAKGYVLGIWRDSIARGFIEEYRGVRGSGRASAGRHALGKNLHVVN